ncbi:hypothetical protein BJY01DRAFT_249056 [Aspergillus pseudoustus]|uniref:Uncharacterized protein n=1 Tax=Aspergillus pseudoustus TaxID=1810923 RepID=A0ABR4JRB1_9EURO
MATIGGRAGAQAWDLTFFDFFAQNAPAVVAEAAASGNPVPSPDEAARLNATKPPLSTKLPLKVDALSVNLKSAYRPGNNEVPLQFQSHPAECRLFFTAENVLRPASAWTAAAKAVWGKGACVQGSTNNTGW